MGLFSFVGSILGGNSQKKAAKKAAAAQIKMFDKAIGEQQRQFDLTRSDFSPYLETGKKGLGGLGDLIGINGTEKWQAAIDALEESPLYQTLFRNGEEALLQNASAIGGIRGGNTARGLADFGADTLTQVIQNQLAQLGGLAGMGMGSTEAVANFGQNKANAISDLFGQQGSAKAGYYLTKGGINAQMWNNAGSFLDSVVSKIPGLPF